MKKRKKIHSPRSPSETSFGDVRMYHTILRSQEGSMSIGIIDLVRYLLRIVLPTLPERFQVYYLFFVRVVNQTTYSLALH